MYEPGERNEGSKSVREGWCPAEKNFSVAVLTGWRKQLKNDLLARKADFFFD